MICPAARAGEETVPELTFETAQPGDAEEIFRFARELILRYEDLSQVDCSRVLAWVRRKIEGSIRQYVCVYLQGEKAAYYRFHACDGMMELDDLYVLPQFRNRKIGTAILQKCCAETDLPVFLYVFAANTGAVALYRRMGFRIAETVGRTRYIMRRDP